MHKDNKYLSEEQARNVYKKVESGSMIDINTLKQEIEQEWELSKLDDTSGDINLYRELKVNNKEKVESLISDGAMVNSKQCSQLCTIWQTPKEFSQFEY